MCHTDSSTTIFIVHECVAYDCVYVGVCKKCVWVQICLWCMLVCLLTYIDLSLLVCLRTRGCESDAKSMQEQGSESE